MKISVIMATFNSEATIQLAIASFLRQDYQQKELIIIDGGSTDNTTQIVNNFASPLIQLHSEPDNGIYDAMNKGLRLITGDVIGCLNSDDCYHDAFALSRISSALEDSSVVSGILHFVREHGKRPVRVWKPMQYVESSYSRGFSVPHPTTYVQRHVLDRVGEFSTAYRSASDYEWFLKALELERFSHVIIEYPLVDMKIGGESTSGLSAIVKNSLEMLKIRRQHLGSGWVDIALFMNLMIKLKQLANKH